MLAICKPASLVPITIISCILLAVGCGKSGEIALGSVTGVVSLDTKPLSGAMITFVPDDGAKESYGRTNESGEYEIAYRPAVEGAAVGKHRVRITTATEHKPRERLPLIYHRKTKLTAEVKSGANTINFDLLSKPK